jgi:hypothetical protein
MMGFHGFPTLPSYKVKLGEFVYVFFRFSLLDLDKPLLISGTLLNKKQK